MDGEDARTDLDRRLEVIWRRTRPAVLERIDAIEIAAGEAPPPDALPVARAEAHKLRGLLGTVGLAHGSVLAAAIEDELDGAVDGEAAAGWEGRVAELATELRSEVEAR